MLIKQLSKPPKDWQNLQFHPLSETFRMHNDEEYPALLSSIKERGYDTAEPIVLYKGQILDGRNRYKASIEAGIEPVFVELEGTEEEARTFVFSRHLGRRNLSYWDRYKFFASTDTKTLNAMGYYDRDTYREKEKLGKPNLRGYYDKGDRSKAVYIQENANKNTFADLEKGALSLKEANKKTRKDAMDKNLEERGIKAREQERLVPERDGITLHNTNIKGVKDKLKADSVDLIMVDPPYLKEGIMEQQIYKQIADLAVKVLKPGGFIVLMNDSYYLDRIFEQMMEYRGRGITWYGDVAHVYKGFGKGDGKNIPMKKSAREDGGIAKIKPEHALITVYIKGEVGAYKGRWLGGSVISTAVPDLKAKEYIHQWQKSPEMMKKLVNMFVRQGMVVLDCCMGSGSTGVATTIYGTGVEFIGVEPDEQNYNKAHARLEEAKRTSPVLEYKVEKGKKKDGEDAEDDILEIIFPMSLQIEEAKEYLNNNSAPKKDKDDKRGVPFYIKDIGGENREVVFGEQGGTKIEGIEPLINFTFFD